MSGLVVTLRLVTDGGGNARAEIVSVAGATRELKGATDTLKGATDQATATTERLTGAKRRRKAATDDAAAATGQLTRETTDARGAAVALATAEEALTRATGQATGAARGQAAANTALAQSQRGAALAAGNMAAQFNDIGVMLAAGQNPLQLAIGQGTQIAQIFGGAGVGGALALLKQGFLSLINPLNLITIGTIAGGAALIQWLTGSGAAAETLADRVKTVTDAYDALRDSGAAAAAGQAELTAEYGRQAVAARAALEEIAALDRLRAERAAAGLGASLLGDITAQSSILSIGSDAEIREFFGLGRYSNAGVTGPIRLRRRVEDLQGAEGLADQIKAAEKLRAVYRDLAEASGEISAAEEAGLRALNEAILEMQRRAAEERASLIDVRGGRNGPGVGEADLGRQAASRDLAADAAKLREAAELQRLIARYGEDSFRVAVARRSAERAIVLEMLATSNASAAAKANYLAMWDAANGIGQANIASAIAEALGFSNNLQAQLGLAWENALGVAQANMAGPISAAAGAAEGLAGWLGTAYENALRLAQEQAATNQLEQIAFANSPGGRALTLYGSRTPGGNAAQDALAERNKPTKAPGAGGGVGGAAEEADAVAELIAELERERDLLGEIDPVMQEMTRQREVLAEATSAERTQVEDLIRARIEEAQRLEALQYVAEETGNALIDALMGGADAAEQLIQALIRAVLQAAILGSGPLKGLFGGGPGLLGMVFGVPSFDGGGTTGGGARAGGLDGKGGFLAMLHPDETVVDHSRGAPRAYRGSGGDSGGASGGSPTTINVTQEIDARGTMGNAEIQGMIASGVRQGLAAFSRVVLPGEVTRILRDPRRQG